MTRGHSPANVAHHLKGIAFPASKRDLMNQARENGADGDVLEVIESISDADYVDMADVMKAYGETDRAVGPESRRTDGHGR
ncbi:MAG: DUF2795 domain-containing protein [Hyphomicrobiaceae bacterium]